jgi:hypothetical protein
MRATRVIRTDAAGSSLDAEDSPRITIALHLDHGTPRCEKQHHGHDDPDGFCVSGSADSQLSPTPLPTVIFNQRTNAHPLSSLQRTGHLGLHSHALGIVTDGHNVVSTNEQYSGSMHCLPV